MLTLRRKAGESLVIGGEVVVRVHEVVGGEVVLAIDAPAEVRVDRDEIHRARVAAGLAAPLPESARFGGRFRRGRRP